MTAAKVLFGRATRQPSLSKSLNKGSWSLWNRNVPLRAQPRSRPVQHPLAAWLNPKSNQHAMHDGSANALSHRGVRELKVARIDVVRARHAVVIGVASHIGTDMFRGTAYQPFSWPMRCDGLRHRVKYVIELTQVWLATWHCGTSHKAVVCPAVFLFEICADAGIGRIRPIVHIKADPHLTPTQVDDEVFGCDGDIFPAQNSALGHSVACIDRVHVCAFCVVERPECAVFLKNGSTLHIGRSADFQCDSFIW